MPYCKNCGTEYQEGAKFCPSCGKPLTSDVAAQQTQQQTQQTAQPSQPSKKKKGISKGCVIAIIIFAFLSILPFITLILPSSEGSRRSTTQEETTEKTDIAHQLACINAGDYVSPRSSQLKEFDRLLNELDSKCKNNRVEIGDISVSCYQELQKRGVNYSLKEVMIGLNEAASTNNNNQDLVQVAAGFMMIATSNQ